MKQRDIDGENKHHKGVDAEGASAVCLVLSGGTGWDKALME